jgi:hypothetical protein
MTTQKILLGSTQTLRSYPTIDVGAVELVRGQPSSVTVRIGTQASQMPDEGDGVVATFDNLSSELTADVLEGVTQLPVEAAAWVRGRQYLLTTPAGDSAPIISKTQGNSATLDLRTELPFDAAEESTVIGNECSKALTVDQTAQPGNGLALWRAVIDGVTYEWAQPFHVVRRMPIPMLTPTGLLEAWPVMRTLRPAQDPTFEGTLAAGWEHRVLNWLQAQGISEEDVVSSDVLVPLHAAGCVLQLADGNESVSADLIARVQRRWDGLSESLLARKDWYAAPQTSASPPPAPAQPDHVARGVRLRR